MKTSFYYTPCDGIGWLQKKLALLYSVIVVVEKGIYLNEDQSEPTATMSPSFLREWMVGG
jgi:hypothetical protein